MARVIPEEFKAHMFRGYPLGTFKPYVDTRESKLAYEIFVWLVMMAGLLGFAWIMVSMPEVGVLGIIYSIITLAALVGIVANAVNPERTLIIASARFVGERGILHDLMLGAAIALICIFVASPPFHIEYPLEVEPTLAGIILIGFLIPLAEESFFGSVVTPTILERHGLFYGTVGSALIFSAFHLAISPFNPAFIALVYGFRAMATLALAATKSSIPGVVGHILFNVTRVL